MEIFRKKTYDFLRSTEKYTKTDNIYLARGGFWLTFGQGATSALAFLLSIAFANLLSVETYGFYKYIISLVGIVGIFSLSGLPVAITRATAKDNEGELKNGFALNIKWSFFIAIISLIMGSYYLIKGNQMLGLGILILGSLSPLIDSAELYNAFLSGKKDFRTASIYRVIRATVVSLGMLVAIILSKNVVFLISIYSILHALTSMYLYKKTLEKYKPNTKTDPDTKRLTFHGSFMNNFASLADRIDNILLFQFLGPASVAIYNFALVIPTHLNGFIKNTGTLAMPKFAQNDKEIVKKTLLEKSLKIAVFGLVLAVSYIFVAPFLFKFIFPQYVSSVTLSQVFSLSLLFSATIPLAFLDSQVAIKEKYIINITSNIIKIFAIFIGIYLWGLWGAIVGKLVSKAIGVSVSFLFAKSI